MHCKRMALLSLAVALGVGGFVLADDMGGMTMPPASPPSTQPHAAHIGR